MTSTEGPVALSATSRPRTSIQPAESVSAAAVSQKMPKRDVFAGRYRL